ncbi:hypothetical protein [Streptomyces sp. NPDC014995]|uniref:hypothetical protein n=1 Tax=Streptomyces sp. NPDC014995 TaxID=3364936 RepID=UPI0036F5C486
MRVLRYGFRRSALDACLAAARDGRPGYVGCVGAGVGWIAPRPIGGGRRTPVRRREDGRSASRGAGCRPSAWPAKGRGTASGGRGPGACLEARLSLYAQAFGLRPSGIPTLELVK